MVQHTRSYVAITFKLMVVDTPLLYLPYYCYINVLQLPYIDILTMLELASHTSACIETQLLHVSINTAANVSFSIC